MGAKQAATFDGLLCDWGFVQPGESHHDALVRVLCAARHWAGERGLIYAGAEAEAARRHQRELNGNYILDSGSSRLGAVG